MKILEAADKATNPAPLCVLVGEDVDVVQTNVDRRADAAEIR